MNVVFLGALLFIVNKQVWDFRVRCLVCRVCEKAKGGHLFLFNLDERVPTLDALPFLTLILAMFILEASDGRTKICDQSAYQRKKWEKTPNSSSNDLFASFV